MSARGRELAEAGEEWRWPTGHTTAELEAVELDPTETEALGVLIRHGRSWVFNYYRRRLRDVGLSWLGIPTAELASEHAQRHMARVLILISRPKVKAGYTFWVPCWWWHPGENLHCGPAGHPRGHEVTLTIQ